MVQKEGVPNGCTKKEFLYHYVFQLPRSRKHHHDYAFFIALY